tara:strand:+ start:348 stop:800 length:453 start_codon:yes stop_codon:yes gene_type:complete
MATVRTAGTEIIRCASFEHVNGGADRKLIVGVQHHIYTILSLIVYCDTRNAAGDTFDLVIRGYDSFGGTTLQANRIFKQNIAAGESFVWNDKFSFNGYEPTNFTGPLDDATKQDAVADQGSSVAQRLEFTPSSASSYYDLTLTYIDQNNA